MKKIYMYFEIKMVMKIIIIILSKNENFMYKNIIIIIMKIF